MILFRFLSLITIFFLFLFIFPLIGSIHGQDFADIDDVNTVFGNAITWVAIIGGFLAFIALIIGGFKYITARGDPKAIAGAQGSMTWAFIGLVLIIVAWLILRFISDFIPGVDVTQFNFQSPFPEP